MLSNYFKIAIRNLIKNKGFTAINILGLSIGVATCLLISLFVIDELSYDKFNEKADRIYRVNVDLRFGGSEQKFAVSSAPLAETVKKELSEVKNAVRFRDYGPFVVKKGQQNINEARVIFADSTLFSVFTLPMIAGNPATALTEPNSVVITNSIAKKYFENKNALGQILRVDNEKDYKVTGIIQDMPSNSHFNFDFFISMVNSEESRNGVWASFNFNTYLLLHDGADPEVVAKKIQKTSDKYLWPQAKQMMNIEPDEFRKLGNYINLSLTPLKDIHLQSDRQVELGVNGNKEVIYIFSIVAAFILIIACVNFMNLSTARSANRAKEVGVRKVLGSQRHELIYQFLTESVLLSLLSFILAIIIAVLMLPYFNTLSSKELSLSVSSQPGLIPALIVSAIIVGVFAGSYPALYLSAFQPIQVLKSKLGGVKHSFFRSSLVVFQFAISIALIIGTIVIFRQLNYIQDKKLGFNKDQVLVIHNGYVLGEKAKVFKDLVKKIPDIKSTSISGYLPVPSSRSDQPFFPEGQVDHKKAVEMQYWTVDHDYISTLGMEIIKGRNFSTDHPTDSNGMIINETAAKLFGFDNPIGKRITSLTDPSTPEIRDNHFVIGVVKNFHFESLRQNIGALCMKLGDSRDAISMRLSGENISKNIGAIEATWKDLAPGEPFNYSFLNEDFNNMYRAEQRSGKIFISFAVLAILIASLGLLGLVTYASEQRTKEIGIRKVLGATVSNIATMLSKEFLKLVLIAALITFPIAWFVMNKWLENFAYRTELNGWIFIIAILLTICIALMTVSFHAIKAGLANPVKSLRTE